MANNEQRPIRIINIRKHAHHGGAWKVAYADFVTAMMAFFLLLWLISSVDEAKLEGLAEYFTPTIGVRDSMGIGFEGGQTANEEGTKKTDTSPPGIVVGVQMQGPVPDQPEKQALVEADTDSKLFEKAQEDIKKAFESDPNLRDLSDNVIVEQSPEGLKIEITDSDRFPMFDPGSIILTQYGRRVLRKLGNVIQVMPNFISITGHTDASPMTSRGQGFSNWELSADRANSARRYLLASGMDPERPKKIIGKASTELLLPDKPLSPRNRRITIILLRGDYLELQPQYLPATRELLSAPTPRNSRSRQFKDNKKELEAKQKELDKRSKPIETPVTIPGQPIGSAPVNALDAPVDSKDVTPPQARQTPLIGVETPAPEPIRERTEEDYQEFLDDR